MKITVMSVQGFIQDFFLGRENVDACKGCMHVLVHPLGFLMKFWTYLWARISYNTVLCYCVVYSIVAVNVIMHNLWQSNNETFAGE